MKSVKHEVINMSLLPSHNHVNMFGSKRIFAYNSKEKNLPIIRNFGNFTIETIKEFHYESNE